MTGASGDEFTRMMIGWTNQVMADRTLTLLAFHVAYIIARHVNRETGDAWPSQARLCDLLEASRRGVQGAIDQLVANRHLQVVTPSGRKGGNRYRPIIHQTEELNAHGGAHEEDVDAHAGAHEIQPYAHGGAHKNQLHAQISADFMRTSVRTNNYIREQSKEESVSPSSTSKATRIRPQLSNAEFEAWWPMYPRKVARKAAEKAYRQAIKNGASAADLMAGVMRYAAERTDQDPQFTKHPTTWLNQGCWADEPAPQPSPMNGAARPTRGIASAQVGVMAAYRTHQPRPDTHQAAADELLRRLRNGATDL